MDNLTERLIEEMDKRNSLLRVQTHIRVIEGAIEEYQDKLKELRAKRGQLIDQIYPEWKEEKEES